MDPSDLIRHANALIEAQRGAPKQVDLRRSISAAYYALFHCFLRAAANDLIGVTAKAQKSAAYRLVYRAFDHSAMLRVCEDAAKAKLPDKLAAALDREQFPREIQYAAKAFSYLQELRHKADYDPILRLYKSEALNASIRAAFAVQQFEAAEKEARQLFLLFMLFKPR